MRGLIARRGAAAIAVAALGLMLPELVAGLSLSDSFVFNLGWTEQFRDSVRAGDPYPRWLARSWDGAGSPTFYFYPPLFFWAAAALDALTLRLLPVHSLVTIASALLLAASGLAMRRWLIGRTGAAAATLAGLAYMATPWHLFDIYSRGSLAEAAAYPFLPLAALALDRLRRGAPASLALLAAAAAGLILAHLPSALLAGVTILPGYALWRALDEPAGRLRFLGLAAAGAALGAALAAFYWVPALHLLGHTAAEGLSGPYFRPSSWFVWRIADWPSVLLAWLVPPIALAALLLASAAWRNGGGEARFWAAAAAALTLAALGLVPGFWSLPYLAQVQFPWRLFVLLDFALITALALAPPRRADWGVRAAALPLGFAAAMALLIVADQAGESWRRFAREAASVRDGWRDAPEYLPRGTPLPLDEKQRPLPAAIRPPAMPLAVAADPRARLSAAPLPGGGLSVESRSPVPTRIVVRRHAFPHWRVTDAGGRPPPAVGAVGGLVSWVAPAGRHRWRLEHGAVPVERQAAAVSMFALLLLALLAGARWVRSRRRSGRRPG